MCGVFETHLADAAGETLHMGEIEALYGGKRGEIWVRDG